jgi:hypothetical protein
MSSPVCMHACMHACMLLVLVLMATPRCQPAPSPPLPRRPPAQLQYAALHSYEDKPEDFMADTVVLRRRFTEDGEGGGGGGGGGHAWAVGVGRACVVRSGGWGGWLPECWDAQLYALAAPHIVMFRT